MLSGTIGGEAGGGVYRLAAGRADITPGEPIPLAGWASRRGLFRRVREPLEVNAIALADDSGEMTVMASVDVLYLGPLAEAVRSAVPGLAPENVLIAATHTHFAPATEPLLSSLGRPDDGYVDDAATTLGGLLAALVDELSAGGGERVRLAVATVAHRSAVHRRRVTRTVRGTRAVRSLPNPDGPRDDRVRVAVARRDDDGAAAAVLWSHACHPVGSPDRMAVSSEFPGVVRQALRKVIADDLPVLFLQGFAADLRPPSLASAIPRGPAALRERLATGRRGFASFSEAGWQSWTRAMSQAVLAGMEAPPAPVVGPISCRRAAAPLDRLFAGAPGDAELAVQRVRVGDQLDILAISAEVAVELLPLVESILPRAIPVSCSDRSLAYLVTRRLQNEGGYEAGDFLRYFGTPWEPRQDTEEVLRSLVQEVAGAAVSS